MRASRRIAAVSIVLLSSAACAHHGARGGKEDIVDGRTGKPAAFDALIADLAGADVVFVGEDHDNPHHHEVERRIATALSAMKPDLAMGMEMLPQTMQPAADRWVAGDLSIEQFEQDTGWDENWGFPIALYRPLLDLARSRHLDLVALNAAPDLVERIEKVGLDGLAPEEKSKLPEMDLTNAAHQQYVRDAFTHFHKMPEDRFQRFYAVQVLWDETMAERTVGAMKHGDATRSVVVFAGTGHLIRRMGIPSRVERRVPGVKTRVVLAVDASGDDGVDVPGAVAEKDADWLWLTADGG